MDRRRTPAAGPRLAAWSAALALGCAAAAAAFPGESPGRRRFSLDAEYFVDQEPLLPTLDEREALRSAPRLYWASVGSYTSTALFNFQRLRLAQPLEGPWTIRLEYETGQDFDGIRERWETGLVRTLPRGWTLELFGEPRARKETAEIGLAAEGRSGDARLRIEGRAPRWFYNRKNDEQGVYDPGPLTLRLDGAARATARLEGFGRVERDLPSTLRKEGVFRQSYRSWKPAAGAILTLENGSRLWGELSGERTRRERAGEAPPGPAAFRMRRCAMDARIEWRGPPEAAAEPVTGIRWVGLEERHDRPEGGGPLPDLEHATRMAYHGRRIPLAAPWSLRATVLLASVRHREADPVDPEREYRSRGFRGKVVLGAERRTPSHRLFAGLSLKTHEIAFGGGSVQAALVF